MRAVMFLIYFALFLAALLSSCVGTKDCTDCCECAPPDITTECVISLELCDSVNDGICMNRECHVSAGEIVIITCVNITDEPLLLYRENSTHEIDSQLVSEYADSSISGNYECRGQGNGSVYAVRSIVLIGEVYVIPHNSQNSNEQACHHNIVEEYIPHYNCCVPTYNRIFNYYPSSHNVSFDVLGTRPIDLSLDVIWSNHYPVNLHLSWTNEMANNDTVQHNVTFSYKDLVLVGVYDIIESYLVISASSDIDKHTMCLPLSLLGGESDLLPNESLPDNVTVDAGQTATFTCDAQVRKSGGLAYTMAYLIQLYNSTQSTECYNCTFDTVELVGCHKINEDMCSSDILFNNSKSGNPSLYLHHFTAHWINPSPTDNGSHVICALAYRGITQWAHTATLIVNPTVTVPDKPSTKTTAVTPALSSLVIIVVGVIVIFIFIIWYRYRKRTNASRALQLQLDQVPLTSSSDISSGTSSPVATNSHSTLPVITFNGSLTHHITREQPYRDSMDSGLDSSVGDIESSKISGSHLQVVSDRRRHSWNDIRNSSTIESQIVCVYVSYSDSQADWVRDILLPLLHSFKPITVTDHEGHMIAGNVISEERLRLLRSADKVVAVVSPDYHTVDWCCYELQHAIQQSPGADGHLIPILCGGCQALPSTISTLHPITIDDPNWTHKLKVAILRHHHYST